MTPIEFTLQVLAPQECLPGFAMQAPRASLLDVFNMFWVRLAARTISLRSKVLTYFEIQAQKNPLSRIFCTCDPDGIRTHDLLDENQLS